MRQFADVLRAPHVAALVLATFVARYPIGINGLAVVLYLRDATGSFAIAGAVAGSLAAGSGIGAPTQGRLVDRLGQRKVLLPLAFVHAASLGAIVVAAEAGASTAVLVACGFVAGFAIPPTSAVLRGLWPELLKDRPELLQTAFALDTVTIEIIFVSGPLITGLITLAASPQAALIISAIAVIAGTAVFTALPPTRALQPDGEHGEGGRLGALSSPGVRSLILISLPAGIGIGICEITIPAFSVHEGHRELAGVLLATWSLGSLLGGVIYGSLTRRPPLDRVHMATATLLAVAILPMAVAPSFAVMALLVIPGGMFIAPLLATRNELIGRVAPAGARTEAYTWPVTAFVGGISVGSALAGLLVEGPGWRVAFLIAASCALAGAGLVWARRHTFAEPAAAVP
jgi:MFS family permease